MKSNLRLHGRFNFTQKRGGLIVAEWTADNLVVNEGKNYALDASLSGGTPITTWYIGIFGGNYTPVAGNVGSTFPSTATEFTDYDEATRPTWSEGGVSGQSITNSGSRATFTISTGVSAQNIYGAFMISSNTKGAGGGTLFAAAQFDTVRVVNAADQLLVTYTVNAS